MFIIGVDPGKSGAAAYIKDGRLVEVRPFKGNIENCRTIGQGIPLDPRYCFIERVTASPQMGVVSAFTFGRWAEAVEGTALLTIGAPHMVRPQVWQNAIGVASGGDKEILYSYAKTLFPTEHKARMFCKATSDAVLIAFYGWRYKKYNS